MQKIFFILAAFLFLHDVHGQKENAALNKLILEFEGLYNDNSYDSIFFMFSPEMAKALPLEKTKTFFSDLKTQSGNIRSYAFEGYESSYARYKIDFERRLMSTFISIDRSRKINGLYIQPYVSTGLPLLKRNITSLILPFGGSWTVMWGGDTKELNYHIEVPVQKHAFDFIITDSSKKSYKTDSRVNEDYYAFGKDIIAPCDGKAVLVVDGIKDNVPGQVNPMFVTGNTVVMLTTNNEYLLFAHFKQHSIVVKDGQLIKQGQALGLCGNSGNSSEPHLHFHIQNAEDLNVATGAKCYFERIKVNGLLKANYSPVRGERIENGNR